MTRQIFAHQAYSLAPTEIIYRIAMRFLLGFDDGIVIDNHHLRKLDTLVYTKDGTLGEKLDEVFK